MSATICVMRPITITKSTPTGDKLADLRLPQACIPTGPWKLQLEGNLALTTV